MSFGLAPHDAVTLVVRGRTTGKARRIPILRTPRRGNDYLVALAGEAQWVRNVRAARGQATVRRRESRRVNLEEIPVASRTAVIAEYLRRARERSGDTAAAKQAEFYFGLKGEPTLKDIAAARPAVSPPCVSVKRPVRWESRSPLRCCRRTRGVSGQ